VRSDRYIIRSDDLNQSTLSAPDLDENFLMMRAEYVHDNTIAPTTNIWQGLRYKGWFELYNRMGGSYSGRGRSATSKLTFNVGFDARHYYPIYRNLIWAVRAAGDFSWGNNKFIYYLGGTDGWLMLGNNAVERNGTIKERYFNTANKPALDQTYVYESLAVNMRGFTQNAANGNNALVINSEIRFPVLSTLLNRPVNNSFLRNFQLVQFFDLGTAWNGQYNKLARPSITYSEENNPLSVVIKAPGVGPFLGSYGFGARTTLLGYFFRADAGWPMNGFFKDKPVWHFSLGLDF
jgi:outer membrane protein assembly factor BamA